MMKRRDLLRNSAALGLIVAGSRPAAGAWFAVANSTESPDNTKSENPIQTNPLTPPADGNIPVAFLISEGAVIIDFCGPWEVFRQAMLMNPMVHPFHPYTVAETTAPVQVGGGMKIIPDYSLENAPEPKVVVIPAQNGGSEAMLQWIRKSAKTADLTMSVCTGAFLLAKTGLLSGKIATTHHGAYRQLAMSYSDIHVRRGARFVEEGNLATAGGLTSGIDLAFHVVERYYGREMAERTAYDMEYQGQGWKSADSNQLYAQVRTSVNGHPVCPVCEMEVDSASALKSVYQGKTYYFCMPVHKENFDSAPKDFLDLGGQQ